MKNVQISETLFVDLCKEFLFDIPDPERKLRIRKELQEKLDALMRRQLYTESKTAPTPAEREQARQQYLDAVGVPESFRWSEGHSPHSPFGDK